MECERKLEKDDKMQGNSQTLENLDFDELKRTLLIFLSNFENILLQLLLLWLCHTNLVGFGQLFLSHHIRSGPNQIQEKTHS